MMPSRLRDCAISHGVDAALAVRVPVIAGRVSPVGLASHVSTAIRSRMARGSWLCQREEPKWLAPAYKWTLVLDALRSADRRTRAPARTRGARNGSGPTGRRSPAIPVHARWERCSDGTTGRSVTAGRCGPSRSAWTVVSGVERAVGASAEDDDFEERLTGYLDQFVDCRWPRLYLTADPLGDPPERR